MPQFVFFFASAVKAGGKRVAKKGFEETPTHTAPEKDAKKSDKIRYARTLQEQCTVKGFKSQVWEFTAAFGSCSSLHFAF